MKKKNYNVALDTIIVAASLESNVEVDEWNCAERHEVVTGYVCLCIRRVLLR